jgi:ABC-2 type transport system permease protein
VVGLVLVLIGGGLVVAVSRLVFGTPWPAQPALLLLAFALGGLAFIALGALLGSFIANTRTMQMLSVLVFGAMAFSLVLGQNGGTSIGSRIAAALPAHHLTALVRTFWLGGAPLAWGSLAALAAVTVAGLAGALETRRRRGAEIF